VQALSAGSNPTPGASPPLGLSPHHPTYPTQPYTWAWPALLALRLVAGVRVDSAAAIVTATAS
jgi:hypothetical protein